MKFSLRRALTGLWVIILVLCLGLGFLVYNLFDQGVGAQLRQGHARLVAATDDAPRRYLEYLHRAESTPSVSDPQFRAELAMMATIALAPRQKVEGGYWSEGAGSLAYAFPTHDGLTMKTDLPTAELSLIRQTIAASRSAQAEVSRRFDADDASILIAARPLPGPPNDVTVWTMTRAALDVGKSYQRLALALGVLLLLGLGSGLLFLHLLRRWTRRVGALEEAIASTPLEDLPALAPTGERDLDRVVGALNNLNARLKIAREELARSDRLIALGRMAAELTHEIGNPLAAMRLRTENALAATSERAPEALRIILSQIGRLEELLNALRLLTSTAEVRPQSVAVLAFLRARFQTIAPAAQEAGVDLKAEPEPAAAAAWSFDERSLARALDNLLLNAVQHSPRGGVVRLGALVTAKSCRFLVADEGPGVSLGEAEKIFEPFVTHRAEGVGLGLALVREIAQAHGGSARLETGAAGARGATFVLELPRWQKS